MTVYNRKFLYMAVRVDMPNLPFFNIQIRDLNFSLNETNCIYILLIVLNLVSLR